MKIHFAQRTVTLPDLYEGYDDVPGLELTVHLHGWAFPRGSEDGEANFRVEVRQSYEDEAAELVGAGFVRATGRQVLEWRAALPLMQALLDGMFGQEPVRLFFSQAAQQALQLPHADPEGEPKQIPLKALKQGRNPFL